MSASVAPLRGHCLCGSVRVEISACTAEVSACHCRMCLAWGGAPFACFEAAPEAVAIEGDLTVYPSSSFAERAFCPRCGSHVWLRDTSPDDAPFEFPPGLFPAADGFPLVREIYADRAPLWARFEGSHHRVTAADYELRARHVP